MKQKEEIENAVSLEHQRNTKSNAVLKQTLELKNKAEVAKENYIRTVESKFRRLTPKIVDYKTSKTDKRISTIRH